MASTPSFLAIEVFKDLGEKMKAFMNALHNNANSPDNKKTLRPFQLKEVVAMTGKGKQTIQRLANEGFINPEPVIRGSVTYNGYNLQDINKVRDKYKTLPSRDKELDDAFVLLIQNFKGGVGKSTTTVNLGSKYAFKGYDVLIIDADPQASATTLLCGSPPDNFTTVENTIFQYVDGEVDSFKPLIRKSYIPGLDFIPSCSRLTMLDVLSGLSLAEMTDSQRKDFYQSIKTGIETIEDDYDIIIIDSPPTLGAISTMCLLAGDGQVVPCPPMNLDFSSTSEYFTMVTELLGVLDLEKRLSFLTFLATKYVKTSAQDQFVEVMRHLFAETHMLYPLFKNRTDIQNLTMDFKTIPEAPPTKKYADIKNNLDDIAFEIEKLIWKSWPSKIDKELQKEYLYVH